MLSLEIDQRVLMVQQIQKALMYIANADIQFQVLIGAGKVTYSSVSGNDLINFLNYQLDSIKGHGCWAPTSAAK